LCLYSKLGADDSAFAMIERRYRDGSGELSFDQTEGEPWAGCAWIKQTGHGVHSIQLVTHACTGHQAVLCSECPMKKGVQIKAVVERQEFNSATKHAQKGWKVLVC
jgi:hypothetical protein